MCCKLVLQFIFYNIVGLLFSYFEVGVFKAASLVGWQDIPILILGWAAVYLFLVFWRSFGNRNLSLSLLNREFILCLRYKTIVSLLGIGNIRKYWIILICWIWVSHSKTWQNQRIPAERFEVVQNTIVFRIFHRIIINIKRFLV